MNKLSTHILDTYSGKPAEGVKVELFKSKSGDFNKIKEDFSNKDGRMDSLLLSGDEMQAGEYQIVFHIGEYFESKNIKSPFLDKVPVIFKIVEGESYHVPLVATPWSYSTYRGS